MLNFFNQLFNNDEILTYDINGGAGSGLPDSSENADNSSLSEFQTPVDLSELLDIETPNSALSN